MTPRSSENDVGDGRASNAVLSGKLSVRNASGRLGPDCPHIIFGALRRAVPFTSRDALRMKTKAVLVAAAKKRPNLLPPLVSANHSSVGGGLCHVVLAGHPFKILRSVVVLGGVSVVDMRSLKVAVHERHADKPRNRKRGVFFRTNRKANHVVSGGCESASDDCRLASHSPMVRDGKASLKPRYRFPLFGGIVLAGHRSPPLASVSQARPGGDSPRRAASIVQPKQRRCKFGEQAFLDDRTQRA